MEGDRYVMLMASLPHLGPPFTLRQTPISSFALERRLRFLDPGDRAVLERVTSLLAWSRLALDEAEGALVARAGAVLSGLRSPALREAVVHRLEVRTALAALRRRRLGRPRPTRPGWGFGRAARIAERRFDEPNLGLERIMPWLPEARSLLETDDRRGLERLILGVVSDRLARLARHHAFDLEAVVLYVLRFQIVDRWTRQDRDAASRRFRDLAGDALTSLPGRLAHG